MADLKVGRVDLTPESANTVGALRLRELQQHEQDVKALRVLNAELLAALKAVSETGDDCPMCDRGRLRNPEKSHWPECPFGRAQAVIAKAEGR